MKNKKLAWFNEFNRYVKTEPSPPSSCDEWMKMNGWYSGSNKRASEERNTYDELMILLKNEMQREHYIYVTDKQKYLPTY